jgi:hypothetical protein
MAIFVLSDAQVTVNTISLGTYVNNVVLNAERDSVEVTAMGGAASANAHVFTGGLQNNSATINFYNDEVAAKTVETLYSALGSGASVLILKNSASGVTFTLTNCFLQTTNPINGATGDLSQQSVTFTGGTLVKS